jgi:hypothetical protein
VVVAGRRETAVFTLVTLAAVLVPVVISTSQARRAGFVWQGKDSLPFALGVPLVAAALLGRSGVLDRFRGRLTGVVAFGLAGGAALAFTGTLRRYAVGNGGPLDFFHTSWRPPLGLALLLAGELVAVFGTAALLRNLVEPWRWLAARHSEPGDPAGDEDEGLSTGTVGSDLAPGTATPGTAAPGTAAAGTAEGDGSG